MKREDLDLERGDKDIVFIDSDLDMEQVSEKEEPRKFLKEKMEEEGLEWENARIVGIFQDEFSVMLQEDGKIILDGEQVYPE
ncbi:MAG: hypothetical protein ABEK04_04825 [Candidatus Nanohalobium sp.]